MTLTKWTAVLGVAAMSVVQMGCVDPCGLSGNGKQGDLDFNVPPRAAQGLEAEVQLLRFPRAVYEGPAFFSRDPGSCHPIEDADIQVDLPTALGSGPATVDKPVGQDVFIDFTCGAQTSDPQEVAVRLMKGEEVLRSDAFDISCHPVAEASVQLVAGLGRPVVGAQYVVGGVLGLTLDLKDAAGEPLFGFGAVPADSMLVPLSRDRILRRELFRVAAPGERPVITVGSGQIHIDVTLVPDASWEPAVEKFATGTTDIFRFSAFPKSVATAERLNGMEECTWTAFTSSGTEVLTDTSCDLEQSAMLPGVNRRIHQMCAESLGRTACVAL